VTLNKYSLRANGNIAGFSLAPIANMFVKAGLSVPLKIVLLPGMDLTDYVKGKG